MRFPRLRKRLGFITAIGVAVIVGAAASGASPEESTEPQSAGGNALLGEHLLDAIFPKEGEHFRKLLEREAQTSGLWIVVRDPQRAERLQGWLEGEPSIVFDFGVVVIATAGEDNEGLVISGYKPLWLYSDRQGRFADAAGLGDDDEAAKYIITDDDGRVRAVGDYVDLSHETALQPMKAWRQGRRIYAAHCARCHGEDGTATGYPFIRRLDGIGKRMTLDEIIEATSATGVVDLNQFDDDELRAMALFVAGL